jgi:hypothetical protein
MFERFAQKWRYVHRNAQVVVRNKFEDTPAQQLGPRSNEPAQADTRKDL